MYQIDNGQTCLKICIESISIFPILKEWYFRSMETVALGKGFVHLMEDRVVVENDHSTVRKRNNVLLYCFFVCLMVVYAYSSYQQYLEDPHVFNTSRSVFRMLFLTLIILPGIINNVIRFSTTDDIPYASIRKHERHGTLFNWNGAIKLYLSNNKTRTLWLDKEEMKKFLLLLDQKLMAYRTTF